MNKTSQASTDYILSIVIAFFIAMAVLFIVFNFAGNVRAVITGDPYGGEEYGISLLLQEEFKMGFVSGMVVLYLLEHALFIFFYYFVAGKRKSLAGERRRADKIFKDEEKERVREPTF